MRLMLVSFHNYDKWWKYIAENITCASETVVVSDVRGEGDICIVDNFYKYLSYPDASIYAANIFGTETLEDIISRCRTLRSVDRDLAIKMVGAMARAVSELYSEWKPTIILCATIDRYVFDVMARLAERRKIPFIEFTTSLIPKSIIFMRRGRMIRVRKSIGDEINEIIRIITDFTWVPAYIDGAAKFNNLAYLKILIKNKLRAYGMKAYRYIKRDPLNSHYLEALPNNKHKSNITDIVVMKYFDCDWLSKLEKIERMRRVFLALQVYPESSIDYWVDDNNLIDHDNIILHKINVLEAAGFHIFIKDHPNQLGYRKKELLARIIQQSNAVIIPYDVPANMIMQNCPYSITFTGTIGFQSAMMGNCSIVTNPYYSLCEERFIKFKNIKDINELPAKMKKFKFPDNLKMVQREILEPIIESSVAGDVFSFIDFKINDRQKLQNLESLIKSLNSNLPKLEKVKFDKDIHGKICAYSIQF